MPRRHFIQLLVGVALFALAACQHPRPASARPTPPLPELVASRLLLAREVAWTKFHSGGPVLDPVREVALLRSILTQAEGLGLPSRVIEPFFTAQIAASRRVQQELIDGWTSGSAPRPPHAPLDLKTELRPRLDALTPALLAAVPAGPDPALADATAQKLAASGFSPTVITLATAPLR